MESVGLSYLIGEHDMKYFVIPICQELHMATAEKNKLGSDLIRGKAAEYCTLAITTIWSVCELPQVNRESNASWSQ